MITEVVHIPAGYVAPYAARHRRGRSGRSQSRRPGGYESQEPEEQGWDDGTDPVGLVKQFPSGQEIHRSNSIHSSPYRVC